MTKVEPSEPNEHLIDLEAQVRQFQRMELPGQPQMMHLGTSYLVNDLWYEIQQLHADLKLRNQTALDRKEIIAQLEGDCDQLRTALVKILEILKNAKPTS